MGVIGTLRLCVTYLWWIRLFLRHINLQINGKFDKLIVVLRWICNEIFFCRNKSKYNCTLSKYPERRTFLSASVHLLHIILNFHLYQQRKMTARINEIFIQFSFNFPSTHTCWNDVIQFVKYIYIKREYHDWNEFINLISRIWFSH